MIRSSAEKQEYKGEQRERRPDAPEPADKPVLQPRGTRTLTDKTQEKIAERERHHGDEDNQSHACLQPLESVRHRCRVVAGHPRP